ncbi:S-layer homology domain-containing protein [Paenibacillus sp. GCM10027626]|uniref:S-layer homology domain-containing protein n=1 Tax=Paenibacillus sp. GCM10027626 TaxID=3273411 RepID=UPI00362733C7
MKQKHQRSGMKKLTNLLLAVVMLLSSNALFPVRGYAADDPIIYLFKKAALDPGTPEWHLIGPAIGVTPAVSLFDTLISIDAWADGQSRSFGFDVPAAGQYELNMQGQLMDLGGIGRLYVDDIPVGIFDFYDPVSMADQFESAVKSIAVMQLTEGLHELKLEAIGHTAGSWRRNMHPTKFILYPVSGGLSVKELVIDWAAQPMVIGSYAQLKTKIMLDNDIEAIGTGLQVSYSSDDPVIAVVDPQSGRVEATGVGTTTIRAALNYGGQSYSASLPFHVQVLTNAKTESTLYTAAKVLAARDNIAAYDWAQSMRDSAVVQADVYLNAGLEFLWNWVPPQSLPRSVFVNQELGSPVTGKEIDKYGVYPYILDPINEPWKITDPSSGYKFPTNDFKSYYESGLNEHGIFDRSLADPAFLVNTLYPEKGAGWGVDDGRGWIDENGNYFTFIAYYVHWLWGAYDNTGEMRKALNVLRDAYLYTGDVKYARAGTVLLDRIADVYPSQDISVYGMEHYFNSHGFTGLGKAIGNMWEPFLIKDLLRAYDAFFPAMDDPQLIAFLKSKAQQYDLGPLKSSATGIRKNIEAGIVEQVYPGTKAAQMAGNNGVHQSALAMAAVVYDKMPQTGEWLDFNFASGGLEWPPYHVSGGNMGATFVNEVDRDGAGNESSASYNNLWLTSYLETADILDGYAGYPAADLYDHVKFRKMFSALYPLMLGEKYTANIGDASRTGNPWVAFDQAQMLKAFDKYEEPIFAQLAYFMNNNSTAGIHRDIFSANPEQIAADIQGVIDNHGLLKLDSINMTGYGFAALRDGENPADIGGIRYPFQQQPIESKSAQAAVAVRNGALEFAAAAEGDQITFEFDVAAVNQYEVLIKPARSIWYGGSGKYQVKLDGQPVHEIDFQGTRQNRETLGIHSLAAGTHTIQFVNIGKSAQSASLKMSLFELALLDQEAQTERNALGSNTLRDMWMYYGRNYAHGHADNLNLGLVAFGLDLSPDLGYPESTQATDTHNTEWVRNTIAHNTVIVDRKKQAEQWSGAPKQFDDGLMVKLIDVEGPEVYTQTDLYKRTTAMIHVDDANSYLVDFFRVKGGNEHHFSFHGAEGQVAAEGLNLVNQTTGSYAGPNVPFGQRESDADGTGYQYVGSGFHYLKNVQRAAGPASPFSVDWAVKDTWGVLDQPENIHLRLTMLNQVDEVALADGVPSRTEKGNPETLKYMVAKRSGTNLSSTFTSVIEPYKDERFVDTITALPVKAGGIAANELDVRAVKVVLDNGRTDYIVSALNPGTRYTVDDKLQFKGTFGVYSEKNGQMVYSYVNDGTVMGTLNAPEINQAFGRIQGTVADFTKDLQRDNEIIAELNLQGMAAAQLTGRTVYVQHAGTPNAVFKIKGVAELGNGRYALKLGDTTLIRSYKNDDDFSEGFVYDIAENDSLNIPLSYEKTADPATPSQPGGGISYVPQADNNQSTAGIVVEINGVPQKNAGTIKTETDTADGKKVTTVTIDDKRILEQLAAAPAGVHLKIGINDDSDAAVAQFTLGLLRELAAKSATVELAANIAAYRLPAGAIDPEVVRLGAAETLIRMEIEAAAIPSADPQLKLLAPAVAFRTLAVLEDKTTPIGPLHAYAERTIKLTEAPAPGEIATGVVLQPDGSVSHVPTKLNEHDKTAAAATISTLTDGVYTIIGNRRSFVDIAGHWGRAAIEQLAARYIVQGVDGKQFKPGNEITRAEFVTILAKALGLQGKQGLGTIASSAFSDVEPGTWYFDAVSSVVSYGMVKGYADHTFKPDQRITREEAMVMLERSMTLLHLDTMLEEADEGKWLAQFSDSGDFSAWARHAAALHTKYGIITGANGRARPQAAITRGETATIIQRLLETSGIVSTAVEHAAEDSAVKKKA